MALGGYSANAQKPLRLDGFSQWRTGHDEDTQQLVPERGREGLVGIKGKTLAHVKFIVREYGELSFPIDPTTAEGEEAKKTDLRKAKFIGICYKSNHDVVLQLRETGVHGGVHNRVVLPASEKFVTRRIYFSEFKGGKTELDLGNVAKFNFAFLSNNTADGFAELIVKRFRIKGYGTWR